MTTTLSPHLLIQQGEGLTIEFKERFTPRIAEDMVAFANSRGGSILLGVRDNGTLVEERLTNSLKAQILSVARNCSPPIEVQARQIDKAIEIIVPEGQEKPYSCSSGYFRRLDAATQKMSRKELALLFQKSDRVPFEERLCTAAVRKDVSPIKVRDFMQKAGSGSRRIPVESFLKSLRLVESAGIRNAALLLFGEKPWNFLHQCELVCIRFSDKYGVDIFDRMDDRGDLVSQCQTAMFFIQKHLHRRSVIQGTYRKDVYDIPEEAFREALAN
ncbi:MAG TPA: RNA-binding domain-containing protein, partial [Fibrobacteraceae bacterium]|nr:RNA-binding domain-containing protein [Fibrobacteraceae bacterium]